ncbi:MAG TPA: hypothetical protein VLL08_05605 [Kineosporiaceae bacterium]|nr:hypothetical protein [Kineosporiaceae bacterium]
MTVNFYPDDPDDFCEQSENGSFADDFFADSFFADDEDEPEDDADELTVDFTFDVENKRLACIFTDGLWRMGVPELYLRPPGPGSDDAMTDTRLAVFLATGLIHLGYRLLAAEGFDVPPYHAELDGRQVQFWLGDQEAPFEGLAHSLNPDVDTVIKVHCSLWHAPLLGGG